MYHSDDAFAMMLLTLPLSPMGDSTVRPLSFDELSALAGKLGVESEGRLSRLLGQDMFSLMRLFGIDEEYAYRLCLLLGRDMLLSRLVEDCVSKGTEIVTPFDEPYPENVKQRLGVYYSPIFFAKGNLALLEAPYVGITGISGIRTAPEVKKGIEHLLYTCALNNFGLVTGEEAGVCRLAAGYALENESRLICALTGGFDDFTTDEGHAYAIEDGSMLVLSTAHPAAAPNPAVSPLRNKLIFTLSHACFVLTTDLRRGEADAAKKKLCDYNYVLTDPSLPQNASLVNKGFEPIRDLSSFDTATHAAKWRRPLAQQMSFL